MKVLFVFITLVISLNSMAQSKKEQIATLTKSLAKKLKKLVMI